MTHSDHAAPDHISQTGAQESQLSRDVVTIRRSMEEIEQGNFKEAGEFFDSLRAKLLAMKASRDRSLTE